jgi:hypothetical protein
MKIFLPSDGETRQLMEHAWQEFQKQDVSDLAADGNEDNKRIKTNKDYDRRTSSKKD